jgi:hypothetical protein
VSGQGEGDWERPPQLDLRAADAMCLFGALRRYRYPNVAFSEPGPDADQLDGLMDRLIEYANRRRRWENLYLPPEEEVPF